MINQLNSYVSEYVPDKIKANLMLKAFGITKVPLIFATGAHVKEISDSVCKVEIPFRHVKKANRLIFLR